MSAPRTGLAFVLLAISASTSHAQPASLPEGARLRLGSAGMALDAGLTAAALSPDGKYLVAGGNGGLAIFDRASGKRLAQVAVNGAFVGGAAAIMFAPTGKVIAFGDFRSITLAEVPSGRLLHKLQVNDPNFNQPHGLSFSADGKVVSVGMNMPGNRQSTKAYVWEVATGKALGTFEAMQNWTCATALSPDGKVLATWGRYTRNTPGKPALGPAPGQIIQLWDIATGKERRQITVDPVNTQVSAAAFAPDGKTLAVASGMSTFHLFDPQTGKELRHFAGRRGNLTSLCFSPDGRLLVAGSFDGGVQAWDIVADKRLELAAGPKAQPLSFAFPARGEVLALGVVSQTLVWWDALTGKTNKPGPGHYAPVIGVGFTPDGKAVRSASFDGTVLSWDPATGKLVREVRLIDEEMLRMGGNLRNAYSSFALSPDGRFAATSSIYGRNSVRLWQLASGQAVCDFESGRYAHDHGMAFSGNGNRLVTTGAAKLVNVWDTDAGREAAAINYEIPGNPLGGSAPRLACSPDGKRVAIVVQHIAPGAGVGSRLLLLDTTRGKEILATDAPAGNSVGRGAANFAFSADGKLLALPTGNTVALLRADTGKEDRRLALGPAATVSALAFSPDGRTLAVASGGDRRVNPVGNTLVTTVSHVQLWELASGQLRAQFTGHLGAVACLAFSPDGATLASGGSDTTVMLWDSAGTRGHMPRTLTAQELAAAWSALAQPDGQAAFRTQRELIASPAEAVAFLRKHLQPAKAAVVDAAKIDELVANLDHDNFEKRDDATRALEGLGAAAEPSLRKARAGNVSLEMRRRIDDLLARLDRRGLTSEELQATRTIEVLERLATPEARELLALLAGGAPEAMCSQQARAALMRMKR